MKSTQSPDSNAGIARSKFSYMTATYCLGVFNDNFFKQVAMLLAVTLGLSQLQGYATLLFALPFILFSSIAGWVADRFSKKRVVIVSKGVELCAMLVGAVGLIYGYWPCILAMVFLMGLQSTFFSPALNGSIPELYSEYQVPRANGILKLLTTLSVLAGVACAGISLDLNFQIGSSLIPEVVLAAGVAVIIGLGGVLTSFGTYSKPAAGTTVPFPKLGPISSIKDTIEISRDRQLLLAIMADGCFYFMASMIVLVVNVLGIQELGMSEMATSMLSVSLMIGISVGSLIVSRRINMKKWSRYLVHSSWAIALSLFLGTFVTLLTPATQFYWLSVCLAAAGLAGGFLIIPVASVLQTRPSRSDKGKVLAASNFCVFCAILLSGIIFSVLDSVLLPSQMLGCIAVFAGVTALILLIIRSLIEKSFATSAAGLLRGILSLRYDIEVSGLDDIEHIRDRGTVFLPNHPALIDPAILMSILYKKFRPRSLADEEQVNKPLVRQAVKLINPIIIPDVAKQGQSSKRRVIGALREVTKSLNNNEEIVIYPSGRLYRSYLENLGGNSGVEYILKNVPDTRIILVRTTGLWGSSFSHAKGVQPSINSSLGRIVLYLLANMIFFGPRRKVKVELIENHSLKTLKSRMEINSYLEQFYNETALQHSHIPYYWWQGSVPRRLPEPQVIRASGNLQTIPSTTQALVKQKIEEIVGDEVATSHRLANELGIDSLTMLEISQWLEGEFGVTIENLQFLETVGDVMLAAGGQLQNADGNNATQVNPKWFQSQNSILKLEKGNNIAELFLSQALANKSKVVVSDQITGSKTYRDILTAIMLLRPEIGKIDAKYVGIMLPASVSAAIIYLATLFSGKIPVMLNWTVGLSGLSHGVSQTGLTHIITAKALCDRIEDQGMDLSTVKVEWLYLEEIKKGMTATQKICAFVKTQFGGTRLRKTKIHDTAVVLFTSGSESLPKAVPLGHDNILANLRDFTTMTSFTDDDRLLGMLPPFHSLGLAGTIILPLCLGMRTVYHANPTEAATLAGIIDSHHVTMLIGTPTFLSAIIKAGTQEQLQSLKLAYTGAEKCPDSVYEAFSSINHEARLCEGYGITECSPLVSLNTRDDNHPGTIGRILPSLEYAIVDDDTGQEVSRGDRGLLLVRGPSIFSGYLNDSKGSGFIQFNGKRWYQTGDFVREQQERILHFCGRKKRFIKLGGEMISLVAIEDVLVKNYADHANDGPVLAVESSGTVETQEIVLFSTFATTRQEVNAVLQRAGLSPLHHIKAIVRVDEVPILGTGKTDYKMLKEQLALKN